MVKTLQLKLVLLLCMIVGASTAWAQSDFSSTETSNVTLTAGSNATSCKVNSQDGIKVGTSSKGGDMTVTVPAGTTHLHLHAAAWKGVSGLSLNISGATVSPTSISLTADDGISNNSPFTLSGDASDFYFVIELSNITADTSIIFTTSTTKRFVIWGVNAETVSGGGSTTEKVATPTFDPAAGTYTTPQSVVLSTTTSDATIHYTTDGTTPTASSPTYTSAITVNTSMTIKAIAVKSNMDDSGVATAAYVIKPATPVITLNGLSATITCETENTTIYYTTDGTTPDNNSTTYTTAFDVVSGETIKAIAYDTHGNASDVKTLTVSSVIPSPKNINSNYYVKVTDVAGIENGDAVLIVHEGSTSAMSTTQNANNRPKASVLNKLSNGVIDGPASDVQKLVLVNDGNNGWYFYTGEAGYLYAASSSSNWLRTEAEPDDNGNAKAAISFKTNGDASIIFQGTYSHNILQYNTGNSIFSCYSNAQQDVQLYVEVARANVATPTFSVAEGSYEEAQSVEISCATAGATIYYTLDGTDPTTSSTEYNGAISITATTTLKAIAVKDSETSNIATATYTIASIQTIAEARAQGTGSVKTKGVVTSCSGSTAYIQDATAAICVFGSSLTVGNEVKVQGTLTDYNGLLEITSPTVTVLSQNNTVTPEVMTIAQVKASTNQGWLVKVENAIVSAISGQNVTIAQGSDEIVARFNDANDITFSVNDNITLTANIGCYNTAQLANPTDVQVVQNTTPSITVTTANQSISVPAAGVTDATLDFTYDNLPASPSFSVIFCDAQGADLAAANVPTWITAGVTAGTVTYTVYANTNTVERTAYFKIHALDSNDDDVYSDLVTVTQAAYVPGDDPIAAATANGCFVKVTNTTDITNGQYLIVYEDGNVAFDGGLENLDVAGNTIAVSIYGDKIPATSATVAATFAIWTSGHIKSAWGKYIGKTADSNGMDANTDTQYANTISIDADGDADILGSGGAYLRYNSASGQERFRYFKSSTYTGQKAIQLYKWDATATVPTDVTITIKADFDGTTYSSKYALDFENMSINDNNNGATAYIVTNASGSTTAVTKVPAKTGLYIEADNTPTSNLVLTVPVIANGEATAVSGNLLVPTYGDPFVNGTNTYYVYGKQDGKCAFYKVPAGGYTPSANKAVLEIGGNSAKDFIDVNGGATSISTIDNSQFAIDNCYDLSGRRVAQPTQKGIYVVNGKKVVIK